MGTNCNSCRYAVKRSNILSAQGAAAAGPDISCHRFPPTPCAVVVPAAGGVAVNITSQWAGITADQWCGEWTPKVGFNSA